MIQLTNGGVAQVRSAPPLAARRSATAYPQQLPR